MSFGFNPFTGNLDFVDRSLWFGISDSITASATKAVDSVANSDWQHLKYIITVFNDSNTEYRSFEYHVLNNNGSYKDTVSHRLRSGANISVNSVNNAGTFELQIENKESFDLNIELARLVLG